MHSIFFRIREFFVLQSTVVEDAYCCTLLCSKYADNSHMSVSVKIIGTVRAVKIMEGIRKLVNYYRNDKLVYKNIV